MIKRRAPHSGGKDTNKWVNEVRIKFFDEHSFMFPLDRSSKLVLYRGIGWMW